ncbi:conserved hypothetical protein [Mesorhizobium plurifarium]|uniref:VOC domain-containing protein n=1 Tax=Mesorhizobium plurifarium TaxID=69974 RepID=A0A090F1R6_MESPL|nr:conserved hypothetical protein [Mesorhizobium sp. SOD10]CDX35428.1 conserved hypothetical protein [Mesorhizobium plurifarium]
MSRIFGNIQQAGYIVRDIDERVGFLSEQAGIGPWFVRKDVPMQSCIYRGRPIELRLHVAMANSGALQIELIQQASSEASIYTEWLERYPDGGLLQHVAAWQEDFDGALGRALDAGWTVVQEVGSTYGPLVYMEHPRDPQTIFEIAKMGPERQAIFARVAAASEAWDGSDPIRHGLPS